MIPKFVLDWFYNASSRHRLKAIISKIMLGNEGQANVIRLADI